MGDSRAESDLITGEAHMFFKINLKYWASRKPMQVATLLWLCDAAPDPQFNIIEEWGHAFLQQGKKIIIQKIRWKIFICLLK